MKNKIISKKINKKPDDLTARHLKECGIHLGNYPVLGDTFYDIAKKAIINGIPLVPIFNNVLMPLDYINYDFFTLERISDLQTISYAFINFGKICRKKKSDINDFSKSLKAFIFNRNNLLFIHENLSAFSELIHICTHALDQGFDPIELLSIGFQKLLDKNTYLLFYENRKTLQLIIDILKIKIDQRVDPTNFLLNEINQPLILLKSPNTDIDHIKVAFFLESLKKVCQQ